ncbi:hypothetical protein AZE42_07644 [Rhizopogon vesiculosus]|uniref:F-box domain-containing protein n=1 Tax=Rhizopogon vesiculosus TaxID=180088 RepID=A0A1J8QR73_9AGAM|nr:hypothetical protein AZE42_07644 [Rhizopogon vesiculosus]
MNNCYIDRLSDDLLCIIFKLICEEEHAAFYDSFQQRFNGSHWDDWGDDDDYYQPGPSSHDSDFLSTLISAMEVCQRWKCVLSQIPSIWSTFQLSFRQGATSLEHARTFLRLSGSNPLKIILLWDDHSWIPQSVSVENDLRVEEPASREEIMASVHLVSLIQELYAHVHRWREFTLRTTSVAHMYHALSFMSHPSIHPAHMLEKFHVQLVHNERHAAHYFQEPSLFPGSVPPIRDLLLFGIKWSWLSASMFSSTLVNLRMHYDGTFGDKDLGYKRDDALLQLLGGLPNLQSLALELELTFDLDDEHPIVLPQLSSLSIKSRSMGNWTSDFLRCVRMPDLCILTLDEVEREYIETHRTHTHEGILRELARLTDPDIMEDSCLLQLVELHLLNFTHRANAALIHRLYTQMITLEVLTLGPGAGDDNVALTMGLPRPHGLADLPLPGLRTLVVFDVPKDVLWHAISERALVAGPLEELYYEDRENKRNTTVANDWQDRVETYHRIGSVESYRYSDIVSRQWSELE